MLILQNNQEGLIEYILLLFFKITADFARKLGKYSDTKVKWEQICREVRGVAGILKSPKYL